MILVFNQSDTDTEEDYIHKYFDWEVVPREGENLYPDGASLVVSSVGHFFDRSLIQVYCECKDFREFAVLFKSPSWIKGDSK